MEHPFINIPEDCGIDELQSKISELNTKYTIAARSGNSHVCNQILMALESYRNRLNEMYKQQQNNGRDNFDDKINIS